MKRTTQKQHRPCQTLTFVMLSLLALSSVACGGLEDTVQMSIQDVQVNEDGTQVVTVNADCIGGGFLGDDDCAGAKFCIDVLWTSEREDAELNVDDAKVLQKAQTCRTFDDVETLTYSIKSEGVVPPQAKFVRAQGTVFSDELAVGDGDSFEINP